MPFGKSGSCDDGKYTSLKNTSMRMMHATITLNATHADTQKIVTRTTGARASTQVATHTEIATSLAQQVPSNLSHAVRQVCEKVKQTVLHVRSSVCSRPPDSVTALRRKS